MSICNKDGCKKTIDMMQIVFGSLGIHFGSNESSRVPKDGKGEWDT